MPWYADVLLGLNAGALFWNLLFMMSLVIERAERKKKEATPDH